MTSSKEQLKEILNSGNKSDILAVFVFDENDTAERIYKKFALYSRYHFSRYFSSKDSPYHKQMVINIIKSYLGEINYLDIAYRGFAKTTYGKVLLTYFLTNDMRSDRRKYIKVLTKDIKNSKQIVTDTYNMLLELRPFYGDMFLQEGDKKREETMSSFTTVHQVKLTAGTIGQTQRGHVQDAYRPDWIWFDDVEDAKSVRSPVQTQGAIESIEEAITGLSADGNYFVTANYISEYGAVQHFKDKEFIITDIFPILDEDGKPTWDRFTMEKIEELRADSLDWWGEYMCDPARSDNKFFDIETIDRMIEQTIEPIRVEAGMKVFKDYFVGHKYIIGADVAGGGGLDHSAFVVWDVTTGETVATYKNNKIEPRLFAHELARAGNKYGGCIIAPENNSIGVACVDALSDIYSNIYRQENIATHSSFGQGVTKKLGYNTNSRTKPNMLGELKLATQEGSIVVYDKDILLEMRSFVFDDMAVTEPLPTRHFDLLMATSIGWVIRGNATGQKDGLTKYNEMVRRRERVRKYSGL